MPKKLPKDDVDYSKGRAESHCGPTLRDDTGYCAHFYLGFRGKPYRQGGCRKVVGPINPGYWCELFEKTEAKP